MNNSTLQGINIEQLKTYVESTNRAFGGTGWQVPLLSFGGAGISGEGGGYGFGRVTSEQAQELVELAVDIGIKLFDTAPIYGFGLSEQRLGKFLKNKREKVYIATKSGVTWSSSKRVNMTNDPKIAEAMLLQSLRDLATDYIDLYFVHWPDPNVDIRKPLEVLAKYQMKGVIKKIGLCNTNTQDLNLAKEVVRVDVIQSEYNIFQRNAEKEIFPHCEKNSVAFMSWGSLDKGVLEGNYNLKRVYDDCDARRNAPWFNKSDLEKKVLLVEQLKKILPKGINIFDFVNSFYQSQAALSTILVGAKGVEQLDKFIRSCMVGTRPWQEYLNKNEFLERATHWNDQKEN
jgi:myo-inositol catabolism protein IolS